MLHTGHSVLQPMSNCSLKFPITARGTFLSSFNIAKHSNTGLSTVPGVSGLTEFVPSSSAQWRRESVIVPGAFVAPGTLNVRFRAISAFGNNVFIDNINIEKVFGRDLKVKTITAPGSLVCGAFAPVVVVENA